MLLLALLLAIDPPRIESIAPAAKQPWPDDPAVILYDAFDVPADPKSWPYLEPGPDRAGLTDQEALGGRGMSIELRYPKGSQGEGGRKVVFGDSPTGRPRRRGERFDVLYWRHYVKHPKGWQGGAPDKMSRATILTSDRWQQAAILHVWSAGIPLTLDPATGVKGAQVVTTRYNDFPNLRWLGNSPKGSFPVHGDAEQNRWICVEACLKLNTPGKADGSALLWVDGRLDAERKGLDFRGAYAERGVNAVFLEAYWNAGSPVDQSRWYDDFVVSTAPIGPVVADARTVLLLQDPAGAGVEVEIAAPGGESKPAWASKLVTGAFRRIEVDAPLPPGVYVCRIRARDAAGAGSAWSPWHQPFAVR